MSSHASVGTPSRFWLPWRILALAATLLAGAAAWTATQSRPYVTEAVEWTNGDVRLSGTLYLPKEGDRLPAAILLHGSGQMGRIGNNGNKVLYNHAEWLASNGVAVLFYDKRGVGRSTGDFRQAGFDVLAADAAGGLAVLRRHPRIDAERIGTFGVSQGPWIATVLVESGEALAFHMFLTGGPPVTPAEQDLFVEEGQLRRAGAPEDDVIEGLALVRQADEAYRTDAGWDALAAGVARLSQRPWWKAASLAIAGRDDGWWRWFASFMDYDPRPTLRTMKTPIFAAYGSEDRLIDTPRAEQEWDRIRTDAGTAVTVHVYPGVGHALRADAGTSQPDAYWRDLQDWLRAEGVVGG